MSSRSVSDIQTRAEGESLYIRYRSDANVLSYLKNDPSYEFIGEVIFWLHIPMQQLHMIDMAELMTYICSLRYGMGHNVGVLQ